MGLYARKILLEEIPALSCLSKPSTRLKMLNPQRNHITIRLVQNKIRVPLKVQVITSINAIIKFYNDLSNSVGPEHGQQL